MQYLYWLCGLGFKADKKIRLVNDYITAHNVANLDKNDLNSITYLDDKERNELLDQRKKDKLLEEYEKLNSLDVKMISFFDPVFPEQLKNIFNPPIAIFVKGELPKPNEKNVAVVGARTCSPYGEAMAKEIARELANVKVNVISGMALGVDGFAHRGALDGHGKTYAVLGCGCNLIYPPSNGRLYDDILSNGGGIISEYIPNTQPLPILFPGRNRIISGLSAICIVVEARAKSGSLITADFAMEQGRDVFCFPGRVTDKLSEGCNKLISQGAGIITDIDKFLQEQGFKEQIKKNRGSKLTDLSESESQIYKIIDYYPKDISQLMLESGMSQSAVMMGIMSLIGRGFVRELFKNNYVRI